MDKIEMCKGLKDYFIGMRNECWYSYDLDKTYFGSRINAINKVLDTICYWHYTKCITIDLIVNQVKQYIKFNHQRLDTCDLKGQQEYYWCLIQCFKYILFEINFEVSIEDKKQCLRKEITTMAQQ